GGQPGLHATPGSVRAAAGARSLAREPGSVTSAKRPARPDAPAGALELRGLVDESRAELGAGGGTRTHTTLPSRDFKALASTHSATSASLISIAFLSCACKC